MHGAPTLGSLKDPPGPLSLSLGALTAKPDFFSLTGLAVEHESCFGTIPRKGESPPGTNVKVLPPGPSSHHHGGHKSQPLG